MAMLAEPRRRKRYNLCPRGKALYEDDTRFGTKMLEKMGWSKGRGLGANEDGSQEFVRVRFKNDAEGLGYEMRDDQWTTHEEGFNGLLKALNGEEDNGQKESETNGNGSASEEESRPMGFGFKPTEAVEESKPKKLKEKISGVSLEEKSKYSKARVHYKKFTRGKDLAQYSEKDLANIFGKKATEDVEAPAQVEEQPEEEEKPVNPNFAGVQTVSTGLSVNDYFKQKMEAMKKKLSNTSNSNNSSAAETSPFSNKTDDQPAAEEEDEPVKKKKKKKDKKREEELNIEETEQPEEAATEQKKKKKSKRVAEEDVAELEKEMRATEETNPPKRKKKKKDKQEPTEELIASEEPAIDAAAENATKKKKKSKKTEGTTIETPEENEMNEKPAKKKSKKNKREDKEEVVVEPELKEKIALVDPEETEVNKNPAKKKNKKNKREDKEELIVEPELPEETASKREKKSKTKVPDSESAALEEIPHPEPSAEQTKKEPKKHNTDVSAYPEVIVCSGNNSDASAIAMQSGKYLSRKQLLKKLESYNVYKISSFCAEKFHILNMNSYRNSTLAQITGYAIDDQIQLKITEAKMDAQRITSLWEGKIHKYVHTKAPIESVASKFKFRRVQPADIKKINRLKIFSGI